MNLPKQEGEIMAVSKLRTKPKCSSKMKMQFIPYFKPGSLPAVDMGIFSYEVNGLIERYNETTVKSQKIQILNEIRAKIREVERAHIPSYFEKSPAFRKTRNALFYEIQRQYVRMGASPLLDKSTPLSPLSQIIDNMSPDKVDKLLAVLVECKGDQALITTGLKNLYKTEDQSIEAIFFRKFLREHQISFLGGGNSKNFKVVRIDGSEAEVLKVDYRLDASRRAESHLRSQLSDRLTPMYADRQTTYIIPSKDPKKPSKIICRTLLVTQYCHGGGLDAFAEKLNDIKKLENACPVFEQMSSTFLRIQEAGCFFPDAKLSNWLIDGDKVQIADTKSFLFINRDGRFDSKLPQNKDAPFIETHGYRPPEFIDDDEPIDADPAHAFILGLNLYEFITGESAKEKDSSPVEFTQAIFATAKGRQYKNLIEALIQPDPTERMSMDDARFTLLKMYPYPVFDELRALKSSTRDTEMDKFISAKMKKIQDTTTEDELVEILEGLKNTVRRLKVDQALTQVKHIAKDLRIGTNTFFAKGMKLKAERIENAMAKACIEKRMHFKEASIVDADMDTPSLRSM